MKKVIRLTESDLARIVKRVIMEQPEMIKIKAWDNKEKRDMGAPRTYNFDTTNHHLRNNEVRFDAQITGQIPSPMEFYIGCGETGGRVYIMSGKNKRPKPGDILYITDAALKQLTKKCTAYQK
jgi:hypothetical protein